MTSRSLAKRLPILGLLLILLLSALPLAASAGSLDPNTRFYVPKPNQGAVDQINDLARSGNVSDAKLIAQMVALPQAVWFTAGEPRRVRQEVALTVQNATQKGTIPVLVAYNIPFRDCAQYSAGGATSPAEYKAWIDAVAQGIANRQAVVLLEPDGLGIIPWYNPFGDRDTWASNPNYEWCQPAEANKDTAAADRFAMLNYAVDKLKANPGTKVYLDGTHSGWLGAGDSADRLIQAGVNKADGFFMNVSNYELDSHLTKYGAWVSKCIAFGSNPASWGKGHTEWCASQYNPASPNDFSTWGLSDQWYKDNVESQTWWYSTAVLKHFVIDSSRNGQGPWTPTVSYPDPMTWCNPPDRGLGVRPTANTGNELQDAFLWIKLPGESDGECTRGLGPAGQTIDPEWGVIDPAAGKWFSPMALDLVHNANPPLK